jgi:hypothetical protein
MHPHAASAPRRRLLPVADALAIVAFATVGLLAHDHALSASGYARDALPLLCGWFAAAFAFGTYRRPSARTLLAAWAVGVPLGVLVRALVLARSLDGDQVVFLGITLAFTLLFLLAFRAGFRVVLERLSLLPERVKERGVRDHRDAQHDREDDLADARERRDGPAVDHAEERQADRGSRAERRSG